MGVVGNFGKPTTQYTITGDGGLLGGGLTDAACRFSRRYRPNTEALGGWGNSHATRVARRSGSCPSVYSHRPILYRCPMSKYSIHLHILPRYNSVNVKPKADAKKQIIFMILVVDNTINKTH